MLQGLAISWGETCRLLDAIVGGRGYGCTSLANDVKTRLAPPQPKILHPRSLVLESVLGGYGAQSRRWGFV